MPERWGKLALGANLALLFAFALWCRVTSLETSPPPTADEAFFGLQAERVIRGEAPAGSTGSGKPVDVLYTAVEAPLHLAFRPSYAVQRTPAVLFGALGVVLAYALGSRFLDRTTALIAAGLVASMPIAIVYSRLGWEYSEVPALSVLILFFAARSEASWRARIGLFASYLACFHVSPTVLFLAPVPLLWMFVRWGRGVSKSEPLGGPSLLATMAALSAVTVALGVKTRRGATAAWIYETYKFGPCDWTRFWTLYVRHHLGFCQGVWTETNPMLAWCILAIVGALVVFGSWQLVRERAWERLALVAGAIASAAGYHLVIGPDGLHPSMPRYGLFLLVPNAFALAILARALLAPARLPELATLRRFQVACLIGCAWLLMLNFRYNYFAIFESQLPPGTESFWTLGTEYGDPMRDLASTIVRDERRPGRPPGPPRVVAEDWWSYKPLQFHLSRRRRFHVGNFEKLAPARRGAVVRKQMEDGAYAIGPIGGGVDAAVRAAFPPDRLKQWQVQIGAHARYVLYRLEDPAPVASSGAGAVRR